MNLSKIIAMSSLAVLLVACGKSEPSKPAAVPSVEELAADPVRLRELRQQCKTDRPTMGDVLCNRSGRGDEPAFPATARCLIRRRRKPPKF